MDLAKIKRNVAKMAQAGAPESEIDDYISIEGTTIDDIKNFKLPEAKTMVDEIVVGDRSISVPPGTTNAQLEQMETTQKDINIGRADLAANMNPFSAMNAAAQHEWTKLKKGLQMIPAGPEREAELQAEVEQANELFQPVRDQYPGWTLTGSFGPATTPIGTAAGLVGKGVTAIPTLSAAAAKAKASSPALGIPSNIIGQGARVPLIREPALGAAEGWVHPEDNPIMGAAIPAGFAQLGRTFGRGVELPGQKNIITNEQKIIDWGDQHGLVTTPGRRTGIVSNQQTDNALKTNTKTANIFDEVVDQPNQRANNRIILSAFGEGGDEINTAKVKTIETKLGQQYDEALAGGSSDNEILSQELLNLRNNSRSNLTNEDFDLLNKQINRITDELVTYNPGKKATYQIDGSKFQSLDRKLRKRISTEKAQGRIELSSSLQDLRTALQTSMKPSLGDEGLKKFNDLNQQWALLNTVTNSMNSSGRVDMGQLSNALSKHDPAKYSLGNIKEGTIASDINNLAKWHQMEQRGASLGASEAIGQQYKNFQRGGMKENTLGNYLRGVTPKARGFKYGSAATFGGRGGMGVNSESKDSLHPLNIFRNKASDLKEEWMNPLLRIMDEYKAR